MMNRQYKGSRKTKETLINLFLDLDGKGESKINTGIGFFDHMLEQLSKHGLIDLQLEANGDLDVDYHHTVEDVGILLGEAVKEALGNKEGIKRYATIFTPMDEALTMVSIDISGRPYLHFEVAYSGETSGTFEVQLVEEFFRAFVMKAEITLHARCLYGRNNHHIIEGLFKSLGRGLDEAVGKDHRIIGVRSTKGIL